MKYTAFNIRNFDKALHRELKLAALYQNTTMRDLLHKLLRQGLDNLKKETQKN